MEAGSGVRSHTSITEMQTPTRMDASKRLLSMRVGPSAKALVTTRYVPRQGSELGGGVSPESPRASTTPGGAAERSGLHPEDFNLAFHVGDDAVKVADNRARLEQWLASREGVHGSLRWMNQVHSARAVTIPGDGAGAEPPRADALLWDRRADQDSSTGALAVMTADCVPLLLASRDGMVLAVAHAGRVGMLDGIVPATLEAFAQAGVASAEIWALVGPSISGAHYELPEDMVGQAAAQEPATRAVTRQGTAGLDVAAGVVAQLQRAGVSHIARLPVCTWEDPRFFSYRREGQTGRMACVIFPSRIS